MCVVGGWVDGMGGVGVGRFSGNEGVGWDIID